MMRMQRLSNSLKDFVLLSTTLYQPGIEEVYQPAISHWLEAVTEDYLCLCQIKIRKPGVTDIILSLLFIWS